MKVLGSVSWYCQKNKKLKLYKRCQTLGAQRSNKQNPTNTQAWQESNWRSAEGKDHSTGASPGRPHTSEQHPEANQEGGSFPAAGAVSPIARGGAMALPLILFSLLTAYYETLPFHRLLSKICSLWNSGQLRHPFCTRFHLSKSRCT